MQQLQEKPGVKIGLETHVQLNTKSKIFCPCQNPSVLKEEPQPNTLTCPTCLGMPGSKPSFNKHVLLLALKIALALDCHIPDSIFFSRKTYFYPDMAKNYQITQYEMPLAKGGSIRITAKGKEKEIRIRRINLEEDPSKLVHSEKCCLADYNRSGIPLAEIVTEPDFSSPEEARLYVQKLETIMEYLHAYDSSSLAVIKSDANISLSGGERVEIKNITGAKEVEQALKYEIIRQQNMLRMGKKIEMSTVSWQPELGITKLMRAKETEEDYGYIFDPDLTAINTVRYIPGVQKELPEMPDAKHERFIRSYRISDKLAESLVSEKELADLFEKAAHIDARAAASFIAGYLKKTLNWSNLKYRNAGLEDRWVLDIIGMLKNRRITDRNAEMAARKMVEEKLSPKQIVEKHGMEREDATTNTEISIERLLEKNKKAVSDYRRGEKKALHFLVGLAMKETRGKIDSLELKNLIIRAIRNKRN
ncbi:MAG: Asp-tRNA(Asn)/Glu-tRNA(Gln) amidotransferase subunit GatB [Candidatus Aenigmarchaeota archaeon]|nr:Asp-tRNA(Asn)/Glu-tRNA(Gln) amidotransferase subunit GatB [Candidatus Aenigmarchaeota archaeon]